ncbi:methyltransferase-like protein 24 [Biomphalaria pfeifferi]|uniref:Methyltransferase-like protein 24 n=1 Tax=Biomphalaria pfeifferi TaxID=112525 RepID=A0AAD8F3L5_BIOPF|nr:methyltransferase-like protein 24 [Biomphalaria pfeifferi]
MSTKVVNTIAIVSCVVFAVLMTLHLLPGSLTCDSKTSDDLQEAKARIKELTNELSKFKSLVDTGSQGELKSAQPNIQKKFSPGHENFQEDLGSGPLKLVREKGYAHDLVKLELDKLTDEELLMTMHSYVDNIDVLCRRKFRMGNLGDGGWEVCDDPDVRPRDPCIVYSFGINNDFSFDDDVATVYGCHVFSFDPSMTKMPEAINRSDKVHFHRIGLDGRTYVNAINWSLYTLQDIRKKLGHQGEVIDVIKMDIENSEWPAIPEMTESGAFDKVKQLFLEYHMEKTDRNFLLPKLKAIQLVEKAGFKKFYAHKNPECKFSVEGFPVVRTKCYELHYLKRWLPH